MEGVEYIKHSANPKLWGGGRWKGEGYMVDVGYGGGGKSDRVE